MSLELKQMLVDALSMMERAEVIDFNGHMSCRLPGTDHVLINSGKSVRSALTVEDIIEIDLDGRPVGTEVVPPMEFHIHTEIYRRRPDVNAVAHTHPVWSTLFSMVGVPVEPVTIKSLLFTQDPRGPGMRGHHGHSHAHGHDHAHGEGHHHHRHHRAGRKAEGGR